MLLIFFFFNLSPHSLEAREGLFFNHLMMPCYLLICCYPKDRLISNLLKDQEHYNKIKNQKISNFLFLFLVIFLTLSSSKVGSTYNTCATVLKQQKQEENRITKLICTPLACKRYETFELYF